MEIGGDASGSANANAARLAGTGDDEGVGRRVSTSDPRPAKLVVES